MNVTKLSQFMDLVEKMGFDATAEFPQGVVLIDAASQSAIERTNAWVAGMPIKGVLVNCLFSEVNARMCVDFAKQANLATKAEPLTVVLPRFCKKLKDQAECRKVLANVGINDVRCWKSGTQIGSTGCPTMIPLLRGQLSPAMVAVAQKILGSGYLKALDATFEAKAKDWNRVDRDAILTMVKDFDKAYLAASGTVPSLGAFLIRSEFKDHGFMYLAVSAADEKEAFGLVRHCDKNAHDIDLVIAWLHLRYCVRMDQLLVQRERAAVRAREAREKADYEATDVGRASLSTMQIAFGKAGLKVAAERDSEPVAEVVAPIVSEATPVAVEHGEAKAGRQTRRSVAATSKRTRRDDVDREEGEAPAPRTDKVRKSRANKETVAA